MKDRAAIESKLRAFFKQLYSEDFGIRPIANGLDLKSIDVGLS